VLDLASFCQETQTKGVTMLYLKRSLAFATFLLVFTALEARAQEKPFDLHGIYLEGCSCKVVCTCDLEGAMVEGCQVMGAMIISSGTYADFNLSGVKIAFAIGDKWVRIYVQAKDSAQSEAAGEMARSLLSSYGTVETIRNAEIELSGSNGNYTLKVDGGKVISGSYNDSEHHFTLEGTNSFFNQDWAVSGKI
jgi:hypothetical protein